MTTFTAPTPLTAQITYALTVLRAARYDGDPDRITLAATRLDRLLDRYSAKPAPGRTNEQTQH